MSRKVTIIVFLILIFFFASVDAGISQEQQGVLVPESANEARLNRLQPPDQVMDAIGIKPGMVVAIGEWLNATSPEQIKTQMEAAGYRLERTETFLEKNNLYIYIFRIDHTQSY